MVGESSALAEGIKLFQSNDLQGARARLETAVAENGSDGKARGYLGIVLMRLGDSTGGVSQLQEAVRLQPNDSGALFNLAVGLTQVGRHEDAKGALQHALVLDPANAKAKAALDQLSVQSAPAAQPPVPSLAVVASPGPLTGYEQTTVQQAQPYAAPQGYPSAPYGAPPQPYGAQPQPYGVPPQPYGLPQQQYGVQQTYPQPPSHYGAPQPYGAPQGSYGGRGGATYAPAAAQRPVGLTAGQRIGRGILWGALMGQCWTAWLGVRFLLSLGMTSSMGVDGSMLAIGLAVFMVIAAVFYAFVGAIAGAIIGAIDADDDSGAVVGVIVSILAMAAQYLVGGRSGLGIVFGIFLAVSIGKWFGAMVSSKACGD